MVSDSASACMEMKGEKFLRNEVKSSRSCPVIYKVSKQQDGSTLHELLPSKGIPLPADNGDPKDINSLPIMMMIEGNVIVDAADKEKPTPCTEKLDVILNETGECSLYNGEDRIDDMSRKESPCNRKLPDQKGHRRCYSLTSSYTTTHSAAIQLGFIRDHTGYTFCRYSGDHEGNTPTMNSKIIAVSPSSPS